MKKQKKSDIEHLERLFTGLMNQGYNIHSIMIAIQNVCAHGTIIEENGGQCGDESLREIFEGFDESIEAAKKMV